MRTSHAAAAWLTCAVVGAAQAGNFTVTPLRVVLTAASPTGTLVIENGAEEAVLVQSQLMAWSQIHGRDVLEETRELLVSPPIFRIGPRSAQTLRVGLMRQAHASRQLTYRLLLQEVPPPAQPGRQAIGVALQLSLPVFVAPGAPASQRLRWHASPTGDGVSLSLVNEGNTHVQLLDLTLTTDDGSVLAEHRPIAYLLAGQSRSWTLARKLPWPSGALRVDARTDRGDVKAVVEVTPGRP